MLHVSYHAHNTHARLIPARVGKSFTLWTDPTLKIFGKHQSLSTQTGMVTATAGLRQRQLSYFAVPQASRRHILTGIVAAGGGQ